MTIAVCFLGVSSASFADGIAGQKADGRLGPPRRGEARPAWWHEVWYGNSVICLGCFVRKGSGKQDGVIEYRVTENGNVQTKRLVKKQFVISECLRVPGGVDVLTSGMFEKGAEVEVYVPETFNGKTKKWLGPRTDEGQDMLVFFDSIGILKVGGFYLKGSVDLEQEKDLRETIRLSKLAP